MRKNVFSKSIQILIIVLLLLTVLVPRMVSQKLMIAAIILWLTCIAGYYLLRSLRGHIRFDFSKKLQAYRDLHKIVNPASFPITQDIPKEKPLPAPSSPVSHHDASQEVMLRHIALRITDKLKSAYPDATWKWKKEPALESILSGSTHRIIVDAMEKYTHADISFDKFARIHIEPLILGSFQPSSAPDSNTAENDTEGREPAVVDVKVWYEMIGQKILQTQITELNCKGHSRLTVKENGDIIIRKQGKELLMTSLDAFPAKNYWQELITLLESDELAGKVSGNTLQISWN